MSAFKAIAREGVGVAHFSLLFEFVHESAKCRQVIHGSTHAAEQQFHHQQFGCQHRRETASYPEVQQKLLGCSSCSLKDQGVLSRSDLISWDSDEALSDCIVVVHDLAVIHISTRGEQVPAGSTSPRISTLSGTERDQHCQGPSEVLGHKLVHQLWSECPIVTSTSS